MQLKNLSKTLRFFFTNLTSLVTAQLSQPINNTEQQRTVHGISTQVNYQTLRKMLLPCECIIDIPEVNSQLPNRRQSRHAFVNQVTSEHAVPTSWHGNS